MSIRHAREAVEFTTPGGTMTSLASPSRGTRELAVWRVHMKPGASGPVHALDHEQIWVALSGRLAATVADKAVAVAEGETLILPAGVLRQLSNTATVPFEALVTSPAETRAALADGKDVGIPPWIA